MGGREAEGPVWEPRGEDEPTPRILQGRGSAGLPRGETKCVRAEAAFNGSWRPQRAWPHLGVQEELCVRNGNEDQGGAPPSSLRKKPAKKRSEIRRWGSRLLRPIHLRGAETYLSQPETRQSERDAPRVCTACSQNSNRIHLQTIPSH